MYALATTSVSVLRGTSTNVYGDVVDDPTAIATGIPAALTVVGELITDQSSQTPRIVRTLTARLPSGTDVTANDQLRDERTGITYAVQDVTAEQFVGRTPDLRLQLRSVT